MGVELRGGGKYVGPVVKCIGGASKASGGGKKQEGHGTGGGKRGKSSLFGSIVSGGEKMWSDSVPVSNKNSVIGSAIGPSYVQKAIPKRLSNDRRHPPQPIPRSINVSLIKPNPTTTLHQSLDRIK